MMRVLVTDEIYDLNEVTTAYRVPQNEGWRTILICMCHKFVKEPVNPLGAEGKEHSLDLRRPILKASLPVRERPQTREEEARGVTALGELVVLKETGFEQPGAGHD